MELREKEYKNHENYSALSFERNDYGESIHLKTKELYDMDRNDKIFTFETRM